jgi:hypothetical protein
MVDPLGLPPRNITFWFGPLPHVPFLEMLSLLALSLLAPLQLLEQLSVSRVEPVRIETLLSCAIVTTKLGTSLFAALSIFFT